MARAGRNRKQGPRQPSGGLIQPTERARENETRSVAIAARVRHLNGLAAFAADPLAGSILGLLHLRWQKDEHGNRIYAISPEQFDAGTAFGSLVRRHASVMGYAIDRIKSPGVELVASGLDCRPDLPEDVVNRIRGDFRDAYNMLMTVGYRAAMDTYDLCVDRLSLREAEDRIMGIKNGLYALSKLHRRR